MLGFGAALAAGLSGRASIHIAGSLGAGKTTLCRGVIRALGYQGAVKSPTFTLVEPYEIDGQRIFHFDFYRLEDPKELDYIGIDEYFDAGSFCLIEWPERALGQLPGHDVEIQIDLVGQMRDLHFRANSRRGEQICQQLERAYKHTGVSDQPGF